LLIPSRFVTAADVGQQILFDEDPRTPDLRAGHTTSSGEVAHGFAVAA